MLRRLNLFQYFLPCCLLGMVLMGFGGKLWLIFTYGTPVPDPAQWQAGLPNLVPEWAAGNVVLAQSNNPVEFPLLARATLGALIHANGQWDDRVTTVVNALLLIGTFALLLAAGARRLGWTAIWAAAVCSGVLLALPLGWDQSLSGSALPDRLAMFFAFPAAWVLLDRDLRSPFWTLGAFSLLLANTAADWAVVVGLAIGAVAAVRIFTTTMRRRRDLAVLALAAAGVGVHLWLHSGHWDRLQLPAPATLLASLAEPWPLLPWLALVIHAPLAIRLALAARDGDRKHSLAPFAALAASAVFTIAWLVAEPVPRHWGEPAGAQDVILLLTTLSFATLTQLWHLRWQSLPVRVCLTVSWVAVLVVGLNFRLDDAVGHELPRRDTQNSATLATFQSYLISSDEAGLAALPAEWRELPGQDQLAATLLEPRLRAVLPFDLQPPVPIQNGPATTSDFAPLKPEQFSLPTPKAPAWAGGPVVQAEGGTVFISLPLPESSTGVLRFQVAGDLGTARFPFALRSTRTGACSPLELEKTTGERWRTINLPRPGDPVVLVAGPAALGTWGAFTHPVQMGTWSWYAGKLAKNWVWFLIGGALSFAGALLLPLAPRAARRDTFALASDGRIVRMATEEE